MVVLGLGFAASMAEARESRHQAAKRVKQAPRYAHIVVDAASGKVLDAEYADQTRHPASLTKVMTLYMTFAQIKAGKLSMNKPLRVSARAAAQSPSKLGLKAGQTIKVRDAVLGLITRSANDASVVLAEAMGGSESRFAQLMTRQARKIGMSKTVYRNASGLPHPAQITTARDQAILARAMIYNFPDFYELFSTASFEFRGNDYHNHNRLMASYNGMDGIKTGYIRDSGFNLMASAMRNNKRLVGVVFGGRTADSRNEQMANLLDRNFERFGTRLADATQVQRAAPPTATPTATPTLASKVAAEEQAEGDADDLVPPAHQPVIQAARDETPANATTSSTAASAASAAPSAPSAEVRLAGLPAAPALTSQPLSGNSAVQLGQFRTLADGHQAIAVAIRMVPGFSGNLFTQVQEMSGANGMTYRPKLLGLHPTTARQMCERLLAQGNSCMVVVSN